MADHLSKDTRSRVMARIRARDTGPELAMRRALATAGLRGWRCNVRALPGRPDIAYTRWKLAIFIDGRFWHGHPNFFTPGKSGAYWDLKIARTQERDRAADTALRAMGWRVLRLWDLEVEQSVDTCVGRVAHALADLKTPRPAVVVDPPHARSREARSARASSAATSGGTALPT